MRHIQTHQLVDRCFELLKDHKYYNKDLIDYNNYGHRYSDGPEMLNRGNSYDLMKKELVQVRALPSKRWSPD